MERLEAFKPFPPKKPIEVGLDPDNIDELEGIIEKLGGEVAVELKKDGFNAAIHKQGNDVRVYTSGKHEYDLASIPELKRDLSLLDDGIYVGEIHGKETTCHFTNADAFDAIQKRQKIGSRGDPELVEEYPLTLSLYDVFAYKDKELLEWSQQDRRQMLEYMVDRNDFENIDLVDRYIVNNGKQLQKLYKKFVDSGKEEGFVLKDANSQVKSRKKNGEIEFPRTSEWVKMKRFSTFDLAVLGIYETESSRERGLPYSSLLLGAYNDETNKYETVVKLPMHPGDEYFQIYEKVKDNLSDFYDAQSEVDYSPEIYDHQEKIPTKVVYDLEDTPVVQVRAMGVTHSKGSWHSCGLDEEGAYSLRISVFEHIRNDKKPKDANTTEYIRRFHDGIN